MKISNQAIDHPRIVIVGVILVLAMALLAAMNISVQRTPAITKAVVLVAIPHPDAQPTETEEQISRKIEEVLGGLKNVDFIASTSLRGSSVTQIVFLDGVNPDQARAEVQDLVERVRNELPAGREVQPVVTDIDFENAPLMLVTIAGPDGFDQRALKQIAEDVQDELETVPGIANTQLFGGLEREIHVNIDPDLAAQYGLQMNDLRRALSDFHAEIPGGSLNTGQFDRRIRNESKFRSVEDIKAAIITEADGRLIRIGDVAEVIDTHRRVKNLAQLDGLNCATIIVNKEADINTLGAAQAVKAKVADLQQQYPHLTFSATRDTSQEISLMFRVLGSSAVFGALLVLVILAWSMGLRISILVLLAIPMSTAIGLIFLFFAGIPISNMVIFSFILVLGMVVDGAIIVAENIHRHIERGEDPVSAAKQGIEEVGLPVIAADATTIAAYLPMLLVPGIMGDFMSVMPKVVSVSLFGSIMVDHFLIPTLAARWYRRREPEQCEKSAFAKIAVGDSNEIMPHDTRVRPNLGFFARGYAAVLRFSLGNRWFVVAWVVLSLFGAYTLYRHIGFDFFPNSDRGQFTVKYELPLGYSIDETIAATKVITEPLDELAAAGELVHYVSAIGSSEGLASRLENDPATGPEFGTIMVELLSPLDRERHEDEIIAELRKRIKPVPGMKVTIEEVKEGPPGGADVAIRLTGKSIEQLGKLSDGIVDRMKDVPGTVDVTSDYRPDNPELVIEPKPEIVGLFGMTEAQLAAAVQIAIAGDNRIQITLDDEDVALRLQLAPQFQRYSEDVTRLVLTSPTGRKATIGQLAEFRRDSGLYAVNRYNRSRAVMPRCNVVEPTKSDDVFKVLREEILPDMGFRPVQGNEMAFMGTVGTATEGVRAQFTGENEERDKNFSYLVNSMAIAVVLIFGILVLQFNSFRQSIVVLVTVPLSFVGVMIGMWVCGFSFSLASFIGLVALTGVVVNDAIVMVDFTNQARKRGLPVKEALMEAGVNRLRPVLLTTVTTIGGLMPLLLNISGGAEFWQPLTGAIVFGLGFATLLTLIVIPVSYSLVYSDALHRVLQWNRNREKRLFGKI
jgi:multidrug efflux pump subunit AcrB